MLTGTAVLRRDVLLWLFLAAAGLLVYLGRGDRPASWSLAAAGVALTAAVALSRALPAVPPVLVLAAAMLDHPWLYDTLTLPALCVLSYLAGRRLAAAGLTRTGIAVLAGMCVAAVLAAELRSSDGWAWFDPALTMLLAAVFWWLAGTYRSRHARLVAEDRANERRATVREARLRERTRIARDMHDSLGHELSLLAVRAGALELASDLAEPHRRAVGELRAAAGTATGRLHEIIDLLRDDAAADTPPDDLTALAARARESGMAVEVHGEPAGSAGTRRLLHDVLREALTNAAKHAPGAPVTVHLGYAGGDAVLTVANPLPETAVAAAGGRRGLAGRTAELRTVGGTLATDTTGGRFTLTATVPGDAAADPDDDTAPAARAPRRPITAVLLPVGITTGLVALLGVAVLGWYAVAAARSTLHPDEYAALRVGTARAAAETVLPAAQAPDRRRGPEPPAPPGADCRYYRSTATPFATYDVYRVCFAGDRLVRKDVL
ncbi:MAG TPA: histidine kinase [Actinocatenispora sp.]